jgi:sortase A
VARAAATVEGWDVMPNRGWIVRALLLLTAVVCLGWVAVATVRMQFAQRELRQRLANASGQLQMLADLGGALPDTLDPRLPLAFGELVGRIEIPRVSLDVMAIEGVRDYLLDKGAGHFHETYFPGLGGNSVFAGHRDTFFRPLREVVEGDTVHVTMPWGRYTYAVNSILVVEPEDVWVLDQRGVEVLTLITCYPFDWLGPAPQRVVITALPATGTSS